MDQELPSTKYESQEDEANKKANNYLANDRTALAWIRTSLAIIGLGFVISRFGLLLRSQAQPALPPATIHYSYILGLAMVGLGVLTLILALISFLRVRRSIELNQFRPTPHFMVLLMALLALLGIFLFLYMWLVG